MSAAVNLAYSSMSDDDPFETDAQQTSSAQNVPVGALNDWQLAAIKKILGFRALEQNWDSYGSRSISQKVAFIAIALLGHASLESMPSPSVLPVSGGAIQLEWSKGNRELELEVRPDGTIVYLTAENGELLDEERPLAAAGQADLLLSWLNGG